MLKDSDIDDSYKFKAIIKDKDMEQCIKKINERKDLFKEKIKNIDFYKIETSFIRENNDIFYYPKDLIFLNESLLLKFLKFLGKDDLVRKKDAEILLNFNYGNIAFKNNKYHFLNNDLYLVYIYSLDKRSFKDINFNSDYILSFIDSMDFNNYFKDIVCLDIKKNCMELSKDFENQYSLKIHLLNNNSVVDQENKLDKILYDLIKLYKEYRNMLIKICSSAYSSSLSSEKEKKYYLIHKKYIEDFETLLNFNNIEIILKNEIYNLSDENQKECLDKVKKTLSSCIKKNLLLIDVNSSFDKLKNCEFYKLQKIELAKVNSYYFENFIIINENIKKILAVYNNLLDNIIESVECCFDNKKFFISFKDNISVGHIEQNNQFIVDNLIVPISSLDTKCIFKTINNKGYIFIETYLKTGKLDFKYEFNYTHNLVDIKADIYNIAQKSWNNINSSFNPFNISGISEKLKKLILLYLEIQNNNLIYSNDKFEEEVCLINSNIIINPFLQEIDLLIKDNKDIFNLLSKYNFNEKCLNSVQFEEIITKINKEKLSQLDSKSFDIRFQTINPNKKEAILKNGEKIIIYDEFVMIRKQVFDKIYIELNLFNASKIFYSKFNEDDIIIDEKKENLLIGKIYNNNYFNVNYILSFKYQSDLRSELNFIKNYGIEQYLKSKAVFNNELTDDYISPIFSKYDNLGYIYKVINGKLDFSDAKNYAKFINNQNFKKTLDLINYYKKFKEIMNSNSANEKEYYLINQKTMTTIKKLYYYKDIKATIDKISQNDTSQANQSRMLLHILKFLPQKVLTNFIEKELDIEKMEKSEIEPLIEPIYPNNIINNKESPLAMIYKNFEIIDAILAKQFCHGIRIDNYYGFLSHYEKDNNLLKCILKDGKVIIKYENNMFGNEKNYVVIGTIDNENTFINQYFLIYNENYSSETHDFNYRDLNNYLNKFQFVNNSCPIVINLVNEIGTIIDLGNSSYNINIVKNDNKMQNVPIPYDNSIGNDNKFSNENNNFHNKENNNNNIIIDDEFNLNSKNNITSIRQNSSFPSLINEYNLEAKFQNIFINQNFALPPLIGLDNIGATCYMNATLQCLCNIPKFVNYFKYNSHLIENVKSDLVIGNLKLSSSFKLLIEKLWPDRLYFYNNNNPSALNYGKIGSNNSFSNKKNESYAPNEFKEKISKMNDLFKGVQANDAKDLVNFLIMTLHEELNTATNQNSNNNAINLNQTNKLLMFQLFSQDFTNKNKSIISDIFYGVNYNVIQCQGCSTQSFNYQTYFFFVFPLEEVRIFKSQNNFNYNNFNNFNYNINFNSNEINIYDCFLYEQRINYMAGQNAMYCNYCKQTCTSSMCTFIASCPEIIIIILNRGKGIQYKVKINFPIQLNLYNFIDFKEAGYNYELIGVITHLGGSDMSGHFIAYCKNPINNMWYQYNDSVVNEVNQANFQAEVVDYAMPYLLFYQKLK